MEFWIIKQSKYSNVNGIDSQYEQISENTLNKSAYIILKH